MLFEESHKLPICMNNVAMYTKQTSRTLGSRVEADFDISNVYLSVFVTLCLPFSFSVGLFVSACVSVSPSLCMSLSIFLSVPLSLSLISDLDGFIYW